MWQRMPDSVMKPAQRMNAGRTSAEWQVYHTSVTLHQNLVTGEDPNSDRKFRELANDTSKHCLHAEEHGKTLLF